MKDVFEVQDEIARKIAEALRITLTPQEQAALAAKPTENLQAYDLYLKGKSYARRLTRQDLEFALQMFESAVALDPDFALAYAAIANVCAQYHYNFGSEQTLDQPGPRRPRSGRSRCGRTCPRCRWRRRGSSTPSAAITTKCGDSARPVIARRRDSRRRLLPPAARALRSRPLPGGREHRRGGARGQAGADYNVYVPIRTRSGRSASRGAAQRAPAPHPGARGPPARGARGRAGADPAGDRLSPTEAASTTLCARRTSRWCCAPTKRSVLYNAACVFCTLGRKTDAMDAMKKACRAGYRRGDWARRDPDLALLHGDPEFEALFPEKDSAS